MKKMTLVFLALLLPLWAGCDNRKDSQKEREQTQLLYLLYVHKDDNLQTRCVASQDVAFQCSTTAYGNPVGPATYVGIMSGIYGITVSTNTSDALCTALLASDNYPVPRSSSNANVTYSTGAKLCNLDCSKDYWQRQIDGSKCNGTDYGNLNPFTDDGFTDCLTKCFTEGTLLPN